MKSPEIKKEFELSEPLCEEFIAGGKAPFVTGVVRLFMRQKPLFVNRKQSKAANGVDRVETEPKNHR